MGELDTSITCVLYKSDACFILKLVFPSEKIEALFEAAAAWLSVAGEDESANIFFAYPPPHFQVHVFFTHPKT
jgi:hypothetical protein